MGWKWCNISNTMFRTITKTRKECSEAHLLGSRRTMKTVLFPVSQTLRVCSHRREIWTYSEFFHSQSWSVKRWKVRWESESRDVDAGTYCRTVASAGVNMCRAICTGLTPTVDLVPVVELLHHMRGLNEGASVWMHIMTFRGIDGFKRTLQPRW